MLMSMISAPHRCCAARHRPSSRVEARDLHKRGLGSRCDVHAPARLRRVPQQHIAVSISDGRGGRRPADRRRKRRSVTTAIGARTTLAGKSSGPDIDGHSWECARPRAAAASPATHYFFLAPRMRRRSRKPSRIPCRGEIFRWRPLARRREHARGALPQGIRPARIRGAHAGPNRRRRHGSSGFGLQLRGRNMMLARTAECHSSGRIPRHRPIDAKCIGRRAAAAAAAVELGACTDSHLHVGVNN